MRLMLDTGFPRADVENDFLRARRRQFLATLAHRLRGGRGGGNRLMVLDDVVGPLGWRGQRQLGLQTIQLDTIIGTAGPRRDFDRRFRPTSARVRDRWERLALAQRRGEAIPPIEVYRVGCAHLWPMATTGSPSPRRPLPFLPARRHRRPCVPRRLAHPVSQPTVGTVPRYQPTVRAPVARQAASATAPVLAIARAAGACDAERRTCHASSPAIRPAPASVSRL